MIQTWAAPVPLPTYSRHRDPSCWSRSAARSPPGPPSSCRANGGQHAEEERGRGHPAGSSSHSQTREGGQQPSGGCRLAAAGARPLRLACDHSLQAGRRLRAEERWVGGRQLGWPSHAAAPPLPPCSPSRGGTPSLSRPRLPHSAPAQVAAVQLSWWLQASPCPLQMHRPSCPPRRRARSRRGALTRKRMRLPPSLPRHAATCCCSSRCHASCRR